ncbi:hypothetical protein ALI144C_30730 [Actinosynnema sp. ALI-1.44]|nr:hypothetical protein ALI144C_30730 [Actinosynnema sp. ALI-1.44]
MRTSKFRVAAVLAGVVAWTSLQSYGVSGAAGPTNAEFTYVSAVGDYVGGGDTQHVTSENGDFTVRSSAGSVEVMALYQRDGQLTFVNITLAAPRGQVITTGTYEGARRAAFREGNTPGIDVVAHGRGCSDVFGKFTVRHIGYGTNGAPASFVADFEQHCESPTAPVLRGSVAVRSV